MPDSANARAIDARQWLGMAAAALLLLALPLAGTWLAHLGEATGVRTPRPAARTGPAAKPAVPPPPVEPMELQDLAPEDARAINAAIPFSDAPNPAARPFHFLGGSEDRSRAVDCLAAAQYYEAGDDPVGQKAVAQVVLNRARHPAFPKSVCGVVFQGSERTTGCQFTFTCDGSMVRTPSPAAWDRARDLARRMLNGLVDKPVGHATHYHTNWVVPYWSSSLDKITEIHTHLFFRWPGWWGTPGAFQRGAGGSEPNVPLLSRLSPAHEKADALTAPQMTAGAAELAGAPKLFVPDERTGPRLVGNAKLVATAPEGDAFIMSLPRQMAVSDYLVMARTFCSGRPKCRIMGWRAEAPPPAAFPVPEASLAKMLFSYIHSADSGLQRLLWNCRVAPQPDKANCMRERVTIRALAPATPKGTAAVPET